MEEQEKEKQDQADMGLCRSAEDLQEVVVDTHLRVDRVTDDRDPVFQSAAELEEKEKGEHPAVAD